MAKVTPPPLSGAEANRWARRVRLGMLLGIGGALILMVVRVLTYAPFWTMPGAVGYLIEPIVPLGMYAAVAGVLPWLVARRSSDAQRVLSIAVVAGCVGGGLDMGSILIESVVGVPQALISILTLIAMLGLFFTFAVAGFWGSRDTETFWGGVSAAVGSALIAIILAVTFGFLLVNIALMTLARGEQSDPDYLRSGWSNPQAFAIANTFDNGFTHLIEAPAIAAIVGSIGSGLGRVRRQPAKRSR